MHPCAAVACTYICTHFNIPVHDDENGDGPQTAAHLHNIGKRDPVKDDRKKRPYDICIIISYNMMVACHMRACFHGEVLRIKKPFSYIIYNFYRKI